MNYQFMLKFYFTVNILRCLWIHTTKFDIVFAD